MNSESVQKFLQESRNVLLIDVRTPGEFKSGHAKGAVNIPLDNIQSVSKKYKNSEVLIVCCRSGMRSGSAASFLKQNGIEAMNGGGWSSLQGRI